MNRRSLPRVPVLDITSRHCMFLRQLRESTNVEACSNRPRLRCKLTETRFEHAEEKAGVVVDAPLNRIAVVEFEVRPYKPS